MGQEDGLLTQPSKYFSYLLSYKRDFIYFHDIWSRRVATTRKLDITDPL